MEARDYIDKFEELIREYKREGYLRERLNTFEINPFTNDNIDDIPIEAGYINIDSYYEKAWRDAKNRIIPTGDGDIDAFNIVILSGNPSTMKYYVRYNDTIYSPNIVSYGAPVIIGSDVSGIRASKGSTYLDLTPNRDISGGVLRAEYHDFYRKTEQDNDMAWELITDKAIVFQSNRLRYDDIQEGKYYYDPVELVLYKLIPYNEFMDYKLQNIFEEAYEEAIASGHTESEAIDIGNAMKEAMYDTVKNYAWRRYTYKLHGTNGNPTSLTYEYVKNNLDKYFYNYNDAETPLYRFNVDTMSWETFGNIVNYTKVDGRYVVHSDEDISLPPDELTVDVPNVNKERYYYFISDDKINELNEKQSEYDVAAEARDAAKAVCNTLEEEHTEAVRLRKIAYDRMVANPTQANIDAYENASRVVNDKVRELREANEVYSNLNTIANTIRNELTKLAQEVYDSGTLYSYDYTVYLKRIPIDETFYASALQFYRNLMHVYGDLTDSIRIDHQSLYLTNGHPGTKILEPDMSRIYLDTRNNKLYKPLEDGFIQVEKPYNVIIITDKDSMDDLEPEDFVDDTYYLFPHINKCYYVDEVMLYQIEARFDDLATEEDESPTSAGRLGADDTSTEEDESTTDMSYIIYDDLDDDTKIEVRYRSAILPNLPMEIESKEDAVLSFNAIYKIGDNYYKYNPYEELSEGHFYFNCNVFY